MDKQQTQNQCATPICLRCGMGPCPHRSPTVDAEYVPGVGWMAVTRAGRYGSYETEAAALRAAIAKAGQ